MNWIGELVVRALILLATSYLIPGFHIGSFTTALVVAIVMAVLNFLVKPLLVFLTLPVTILTLGLFLFVINAILLIVASNFVSGFAIDSFGTALLASLVISVFSSIANNLLD